MRDKGSCPDPEIPTQEGSTNNSNARNGFITINLTKLMTYVKQK
jgi:hypothetical protein